MEWGPAVTLGSPGFPAAPLGSLGGTLEPSRLEFTPDLGVLLTWVAHHRCKLQGPWCETTLPHQLLTQSCGALHICKSEIRQQQLVKPLTLPADLGRGLGVTGRLLT